MLIVMEQGVSDEQIERVAERIRQVGYRPHSIPGSVRTAIAVTGNKDPLDPGTFESLPGVRQSIRVTQPFKLMSSRSEPATCRTFPC